MNSCDNLWYQNIGSNPLRDENGVFNLSGEKIYDFNSIGSNYGISISNNTTINIGGEIKVKSLWVLENCKISSDLCVDGDIRARNNFKLNGKISCLNMYIGHNFEFCGKLIVTETLEIGNKSVINGSIDCKVLRIGENAKINGYIRADKIFAGSNFSSESEVTCNEFMTGENSKLLGENKIGYFYSQNGIMINGGSFIELHTDDNFKSKKSITGTKLIMDNCVIVDGDVIGKEYVRIGDNSQIKGNLICGDYFEYGPGSRIMGKKECKREKQMPPSSAKIRKDGRVYFPDY